MVIFAYILSCVYLYSSGSESVQLSNHLGNVLVTVSDKKNGIADPIRRSLISHFEPVMLSGTDYYPFGMAMRVGGDNKYKYGFNGKENDNEVKGGDGNHVDFDARFLDARIGRWFSTDEKIKPHLNPYNFAQNNPTNHIDLDGKDDIHFHFTTKVIGYTVNAGTPACSTFYKNVTSAHVVVIKNNGPDRFYHHKNYIAANGMTSEKITEFHPFFASKRSGLTTTPLPFSMGVVTFYDRDIHTLGKYYDASPAFKKYLDERMNDGSFKGTLNYRNYKELFFPNKDHYNFWGGVAKGAEITGQAAMLVNAGINIYLKSPSGFGDLTNGEVLQIKSVVNEAGRPLEVVGSAAKGTRRGVGSNLPIGKGPGTRSDIDYMVPHSSMDYYKGLQGKLPSIDRQTGIVGGNGNPYIGPSIKFEPSAKPVAIPAAN